MPTTALVLTVIVIINKHLIKHFQVKKLIDDWQLSRGNTNNVLRLLYEALKESKARYVSN